MTATDIATEADASPSSRSGRSSVLGSWWVIAGFAALLLLVLGWKFLADPSLSAPTREACSRACSPTRS